MARHTKTARATNQDRTNACTESSIAQVQASQVVYVVGRVAEERSHAVIHRLLEHSVQRAEECSVTHVQQIEVQSRRKYDCPRQHRDGRWTYDRGDLDRLPDQLLASRGASQTFVTIGTVGRGRGFRPPPPSLLQNRIRAVGAHHLRRIHTRSMRAQ